MIIIELFKRNDTPYFHAHISFDDRKGRYRYSTGTINRKQAYQKAQAMGEEILGQIDSRRRKRTFEEGLEKYLSGHLKSKNPETFQSTHKYIARKLLAFFKGKYLCDISVGSISDYVDFRRREGIKNGTIKRELAQLKAMLTKAYMEWEWLKEMPRFPKVPSDPPRLRWLNEDEMNHFIQRCYEVGNRSDNLFEDFGNLIVTAFDTGMRKSELLNLNISEGDVDLVQRLLIIRKTKNGHPRSVPMTNRVFDIMEQKIQDFKEGLKLCSHVFSYNDRPVKSFQKSFRRALELAGITDFRPHDMRHTFASLLVQKGVSLKVVQELLGHRKLEMVMVYAHLAQSHHHASITALEEYIPKDAEGLKNDIVNVIEKHLSGKVAPFVERLLALETGTDLLKKVAKNWHRFDTVSGMNDILRVREASFLSIKSDNYDGAGDEIRTHDFNLGKEDESTIYDCWPMIF